MPQWPKQQRLVHNLRAVLRADFRCQDAWVVAGHGRCRLEVRVAGRQFTLLDDQEEPFWARFYTATKRDRLSYGEQVTQTLLWLKSRQELADELSGPWMTRVGPLPARPASSLAAPRLPRA